MWKEDFYPTPKGLAIKLFENCKTDIFNKNQMILEPSAGKGDLIDAYAEAYSSHISEKMGSFQKRDSRFIMSSKDIDSYCTSHIDCVEIEPELVGILRSKGYNVVGNDFLKFNTSTKYTFIMMNPPFSDAHKHLQKAWEILDDGGEIACILPTSFLSNHPQFKSIFSEHGEVISLGEFNDYEDVFRKANVHVSAYYLRKPAKENMFSFDWKYTKDKEVNFNGEERFESEIAVQDIIGNYVTAYERVIDTFVKTAELMSEYAHYAKFFSDEFSYTGFYVKSLVDLVNSCSDKNEQRAAYNSFMKNLKEDAWKKIFSLTGVQSLLTSKLKDDFIKFQKEQSSLSFSKENIESFVMGLYTSQNKIKQQCVVDAFDTLTSFDKRNKIHIEGWKTNSFYKVNKKVIVPYGIDSRFSFSTPYVNSHYYDKLTDIDKALCFIEGKSFEDISSIINTVLKAKNWGETYESEFFFIRCYKKGTIHLTFKSMDTLSRFNRIAVKDKWNCIGYEE